MLTDYHFKLYLSLMVITYEGIMKIEETNKITLYKVDISELGDDYNGYKYMEINKMTKEDKVKISEELVDLVERHLRSLNISNDDTIDILNIFIRAGLEMLEEIKS